MSKLSEKLLSEYWSLDSTSDKTAYIIALLITFFDDAQISRFLELACEQINKQEDNEQTE